VLAKLTLFIICYFSLSLTVAQDTISVFFEFGKSKLTGKTEHKLKLLPVEFDLSSVDSIHFVGRADSVGRLNANLRLSKKRADRVEEFCRYLLPEAVQTSTSAIGEDYNLSRAFNRRVDIILFYKTKPPPPPKPIKQEKKCYRVDYDLLSLTHWRIIKKRRKEYVLIELPLRKNPQSHNVYYGIRDFEGKFSARKVRWKKQNMGRLWWASTRYVTTIPKESFENYKLFKVNDPPCTDCHEPFDSISKITKSVDCLQADYYVMNNLQYSFKLFNRELVEIRVPREYINQDLNYYYEYNKTISWETRNGRKNANYLFAEVPHNDGHISPFTKDAKCPQKDFSECIKRDTSLKSWSLHLLCYHLPPKTKSFSLIGEVGSYYQNDSLIPYAALGIEKESLTSRVTLLAGTDIDLGFYGSLRYQHILFQQPLGVFNPVRNWKSRNNRGRFYGEFYLGTELKTRVNEDEDPLLEQNIHLGFAILNNKSKPVISRLFFQVGYGYDFLRNQQKTFYPILQAGLVFKFLRW
jgi:hypothetical protein